MLRGKYKICNNTSMKYLGFFLFTWILYSYFTRKSNDVIIILFYVVRWTTQRLMNQWLWLCVCGVCVFRSSAQLVIKTPRMTSTIKTSRKVIVRVPGRAMSNLDILYYVDKIQLPNFVGVYMRDTLPSKSWNRNTPQFGIMNLKNNAHGIIMLTKNAFTALHVIEIHLKTISYGKI